MSCNFPRNQKNSDRAGLILLFVGLFFLGVYSLWRFHQARILSFFTREVPKISTERIGEIPVLIKSYPLGVNIKIKEAGIQNGVWQVFPDSVSHLEPSARIGESGNIIIYGHNRNEILGPIRWAKEGTLIELFDKNGIKYLYKVLKTDVIDPSNLTYILPTKEETLTIYTCTGFLDFKRLIVVAKRV